MRGKFIVLEGLDGSGTTTQARLLSERILSAKQNVALAYEPSGPLEKSVREAIHDMENRWPLLWLFAASRASNLSKITPLLDNGTHVVCDRYVMSSLAYQALDHDMDFIWTVNSKFRDADLTIYLDVPVETCLERLAGRTNKDPFETAQILNPVSKNYKKAIAIVEENGGKVEILDGTLPESEVAELIWKLVRPHLGA